MTKTVKVDDVSELISELCLKANYEARPDVRELLRQSLEQSNTPAASLALEQLAANIDVAAAERMPLCQDCGYVTVFADVGQEIIFDGDFNEALQKGVSDAYEQGPLRRSVVRDALFDRVAKEEARPASVYTQLKSGDELNLEVMPKGGGSDNACRVAMLKPTADVEEIVGFVLDTVVVSGPGACPPLFVGVGIGGSFDSVALLAKRALLRDFSGPPVDGRVKDLEDRLLADINKLGIGPAGLGGETTALAVGVLTERTHMACLPVAVNISCNHLRSAKGSF